MTDFREIKIQQWQGIASVIVKNGRRSSRRFTAERWAEIDGALIQNHNGAKLPLKQLAEILLVSESLLTVRAERNNIPAEGKGHPPAISESRRLSIIGEVRKLHDTGQPVVYSKIARKHRLSRAFVANLIKNADGSNSGARQGTEISADLRETIIRALQEPKPQIPTIASENGVSQPTVRRIKSQWESELPEKISRLTLLSTLERLSDILAEIISGPRGSQLVAAKDLGLAQGYLNNILHGRQPVPSDCLDQDRKNWGAVFATSRYARVWYHRKQEFTLLLKHQAQLTATVPEKEAKVRKLLSCTKPRAVIEAAAIVFTADQRSCFASQFRVIRKEHGDSIADFLAQAKDDALTATVVDQIEQNNPRIQSEPIFALYNAARRIYNRHSAQLAHALQPGKINKLSNYSKLIAA